MDIQEAAQAAYQRVRRNKAVWWIGLACTILVSIPDFFFFDLRLDWSHFGYGKEALVPRILLQLGVFLIAVLSPIAWQWTGDDRRIGSPFRSLIQIGALVAIGYLLFQLPIRLLSGQKALFADNWFFQDAYSFLMAVFFVAIFGHAVASHEQEEQLLEDNAINAPDLPRNHYSESAAWPRWEI